MKIGFVNHVPLHVSTALESHDRVPAAPVPALHPPTPAPVSGRANIIALPPLPPPPPTPAVDVVAQPPIMRVPPGYFYY